MIKGKIRENKQLILAISISFITLLIAAVVFCTKTQIYDSEYYWSWGMSIFNNGKINFLNFPETFRGYLYPFIIASLRVIGLKLFNSEWILFILFNCVIFTGIICVLVPKLLEYDMNSKYSWIKSFIFSILVVIFWRNHLVYSLSDIPAMAMFMLAVLMLKNLYKGKGIFPYLLKSFFIGCILYAAYNTRAIYLYAGILVIIYYIIINLKQNKITLIGFIGALILGGALIAIPQMKINEQYTGSSTPRVLTEQLFNYDNNLQMYQIYEGMGMTRYESLITQYEDYDKPAIGYPDVTGKQIIIEEGLTGSLGVLGLGDIIKLYLKYPFDFVSIYMNHIFSYLTIIWSDSTYIDSFCADKYFFFTINVFVWLYALAGWIFKGDCDKKRIGWENWGFLIIMLIPCIMCIPGVPELRFWSLIYFLIYGYICYRVSMNVVINGVIKNIWKVLLIGGTILFVGIGYAGNILRQAEVGAILFHTAAETGLVSKIPDTVRIMGYISLIVSFMIIYKVFVKSKEEGIKKYINSLMNGNRITLIGCSMCIVFSIVFSIWSVYVEKDTIKDILVPEILTEVQEIYTTQKVEVPNSDESLNVIPIEVNLSPETYYKVEFDMTIEDNMPTLFYLDFYNEGYDRAEQDITINPKKGKNHYSYNIFSGKDVPTNVFLRIISITNTSYSIENLKIIEMKSNKN
ncbi:hypothetical protein [Cellulosilyticum lentocellum]|uniref:Uncharacterized protein n=1 Tax=Cellulosilyticum lentocellum (strain ATCC 49066 / DSM 5427 / NCIMB 11756 / RHM5) TaxID=642492 RepID=F2JIL4_CELLD|nr:hypothetical protein [Cellulosilyticum lentocellum]ADZ85484.1 hypothetical protein Clole_3804 [Cellulosilyticum lentocellum DSM 5427]